MKQAKKMSDTERAATYATRRDQPEIIMAAQKAYRWGCLHGFMAGLRAGRKSALRAGRTVNRK